PGDVLVTTNAEFQGVEAAIANLARRRGVEVRLVDIDLPDDEVVPAFARALDGARMAAISHVTYATGQKLPVAAMAGLAHEAGALLALDGAQSVGAIAIDVDELDVDFLALPAQKWLLGPEGMGALYVAARLGDRVQPTFAGIRSLVHRADGNGAL